MIEKEGGIATNFWCFIGFIIMILIIHNMNTNVVNLSEHEVTQEEISVLNKGIKCCPTHGPTDFCIQREDLNRLHRRLRQIALNFWRVGFLLRILWAWSHFHISHTSCVTNGWTLLAFLTASILVCTCMYYSTLPIFSRQTEINYKTTSTFIETITNCLKYFIIGTFHERF